MSTLDDLLVASGKVREIYDLGDDTLLLVASDRMSAFDVILPTPIPDKGRVLTGMTRFWLDRTSHIVANHMLGTAPSELPELARTPELAGRSMHVKKLQMMPIECVVRGYLAGSGWKEYQQHGAVCGVALPAGLTLASRLPAPIFTPATKAEAGAHDENIDFEAAIALIGRERAERVRGVAIRLYSEAAAFALTRGIVIADTKFEFGLDEHGTLTLMDEVLTPDSSRFWPLASYREGVNPPSYDKQYLRDWLEQVQIDGLPWGKKPPAPPLPGDVIAATVERYRAAATALMG
jgi:phosphoribosylaminoimidazole-succinocarboxamide synthase